MIGFSNYQSYICILHIAHITHRIKFFVLPLHIAMCYHVNIYIFIEKMNETFGNLENWPFWKIEWNYDNSFDQMSKLVETYMKLYRCVLFSFLTTDYNDIYAALKWTFVLKDYYENGIKKTLWTLATIKSNRIFYFLFFFVFFSL